MSLNIDHFFFLSLMIYEHKQTLFSISLYYSKQRNDKESKFFGKFQRNQNSTALMNEKHIENPVFSMTYTVDSINKSVTSLYLGRLTVWRIVFYHFLSFRVGLFCIFLDLGLLTALCMVAF